MALAVLAMASPAMGEDALHWIETGTALEMREVAAGHWHPVGGRIHATDPVTRFQAGPDIATLSVPDAPARVMGFNTDLVLGGHQMGNRTAFLALVWSDAPVACGEQLWTMAVDTGLAGFMTPQNVVDLYDYEDFYGELYVSVVPSALQRQIDAAYPGPIVTDVPRRDLRFPISGAGWGDGAYPVVGLYDAGGAMVALYVQFIPAEDEDWLLPPPCVDPEHR